MVKKSTPGSAVSGGWTIKQRRIQYLTGALQILIILGCIWYLLIQPVIIAFLIAPFEIDTGDGFLSKILTPIEGLYIFKLTALVVAAFSPAIINAGLKKSDFIRSNTHAEALFAIHLASVVSAALFVLFLALHGLVRAIDGGASRYVGLLCFVYFVGCIGLLIYLVVESKGNGYLFRREYYYDFMEKRYEKVCIPYLWPMTISNGMSHARILLGLASLSYLLFNWNPQ